MLAVQRLRLRRFGIVALTLALAGLGILAVRLATAPPDYRAVEHRARAALERGQPYQALEAVAEVRGPGPGAGSAMTVAGQAFIQLNRRDDARRALERALELDPRQPLALKLLAAVCIASGDTKKALSCLAEAARLDPADSRPWTVTGKILFMQMEYERAIEAYREALRRNPGDREAREALIAALLYQNGADDASPWVEAALRDQPDEPRILALAAEHAHATGRAELARTLADRALGRDPDNTRALIARARVALDEGQAEAALADAERATTIAPHDVEALHLLSQIEYRLDLDDRAAATSARRDRVRERREAIAKLALIIAEHPGNPSLHCRMGQLATEAGLETLADQSYQAALAINPRFGPALAGLAQLKAAGRARRGGADVDAR